MKPISKIVSRLFTSREIIAVVITLAISVGGGFWVFHSLKREVDIVDNGITVHVKTMKATVGEVLVQNGITVEPHDYIDVPFDHKLERRARITIKRAVPVVVKVDGEEKKIWTYMDTVKETLEKNQILLGELDRMNYSLSDRIQENMEIAITRVKEETATEREVIPFNVVSRKNSRMDEGTSRVVRDGEEGTREKEYKVVFEDGKEVSRNLVRDVIVSDPVDKIIEYGTIMNFSTSRGEVVRYKDVISMRATAYDLSYESCGKTPDHPQYGLTYTGVRVRPGIVAVDPNVIPLGSRLYIEGASRGTPTYGFALAADTGSAVKGDIIDLYFEDHDVVKSWGVKRVNVYILTD